MSYLEKCIIIFLRNKKTSCLQSNLLNCKRFGAKKGLLRGNGTASNDCLPYEKKFFRCYMQFANCFSLPLRIANCLLTLTIACHFFLGLFTNVKVALCNGLFKTSYCCFYYAKMLLQASKVLLVLVFVLK